MTKEEFIQKVTLFGIDAVVAYLVALRSDNPTVVSAVEDLLKQMNASPDWSICDSKETWILLSWLHEIHDPEVIRAAKVLLMTASLGCGEKIAVVSSFVRTHLEACCNDMMLPYSSDYMISRPVLESNRAFICQIAEHAIVF